MKCIFNVPPFVSTASFSTSHFFVVSAQTGAFSFFSWDRNFDYFTVNTYTYTNSITIIYRLNQKRQLNKNSVTESFNKKKSHVIQIEVLSINDETSCSKFLADECYRNS